MFPTENGLASPVFTVPELGLLSGVLSVAFEKNMAIIILI
jgi:hypothetical protein